MKYIHIPFNNYKKGIGGPSTFMRNLRDFMISKRFKFHSSSLSIKKAGGIFFPISYDKYILSHFKDNNLPIIQRLDGIYYPSKHSTQYKKLNKDIKDIYLNYSTHIIFQSQYCRKQCFEMLGEIPEDRYSIIYNGANHNIFYPQQEVTGDSKKSYNLVTTGNFRNIDMLEPIIIALDYLEDDYDFNLTVVGPITNEKLIELIEDKKYINNIKKADLKKVSDILRSSDVFLYSHLNPPCPNSVIEAVSCGLPVVGFDSGSMSDLLSFSKDLLVPVSKKVFQEYNEFDPVLLRDKIIYALNNFDTVKKRVLNNSSLFSFEKTGSQYIDLLKKLINSN